MLILKQNTANSVPTPPAGKGTIFLNTNDDLAVKGADGNVTTFPTAGGSNTQVYFNDDGSFGANANLTFDKTTAVFTVNGNVAAGNVLTNNLLYANGQPWDLSDPGGSNTQIQFNDDESFGGSAALTFDKVTNAVTAQGTIYAANMDAGNTLTANFVSGVLITGNQPNITGVGLLSNLTVGNISSNTIFGNGTIFADGNITAANIYANSGTVGASLIAGTLTTQNQPNITAVGTLGTLDVTGNVLAGNVYANAGTVGGLLVAGTLTTASQPNITSTGTLTSLSVTGNISGGNVSGGNLTSATYLQGTLITAAQPNVTSVGTLTSLTVTGNVSGGNLTTAGEVSATGNVSGGNLTTGGAIAATGNVSGGNLTTAGEVSATGNVSGGNLTTGGAIAATGNVSGGNLTTAGAVSSGTVNSTGNITAGNVYANSGTVGASLVTGTLTTAAQPNITSVGTLTGLSVDGANINLANGVFVGNGSGLSAIAGANITGTVANATHSSTANTVVDAAQSNITSVGTLTGLSVNGNITAANITANTGVFTGNGSGLSALAGGNVTGQVANALVAGTVYTAAQPNITSVGTLTSLSVTGNASAGNISTGGVLSVTGNANVGNIGGAAAIFTTLGGTLTTAAQPNITSVGTLTSLGVTGNVAAGNLTTTGILSVTGTGVSSIAGNLDMTSNNIINLATPVNDSDAATKLYVDNLVSSGIHYHEPVRVESPVALTATYNNGTSGVGATLTNAGANAALVIDGVSVNVADRILIYQQTDQKQNGVYVVTTVGDGSTAWVLTRASDADTYAPSTNSGLDEGSYFFVQEGATGAGESYVCSTVGTITFGTTNIEFAQFGSSQVYNAGTGLTLTNTTFSVNASQTQITSLGNVTTGTWNSLVGGSATFAAGLSGANLASITGGNVTGQVANALVAGTVYTAAQPNITSVGTLTSLGVSGNITAANITANTGIFAGNGSGLTALNASNVSTGTLAQARLANASVTLGNTALTLGATVTTVTGLSSVTSTTFVGALTGAATTAGTVTTAAQPNITSVGTLTSLSVTGNVSAGNVTTTGTIGGAGADFLGNVITTGGNTTAGTITGNWSLSTGSRLNATYADLAEKYESDKTYEPGTVLLFGGEKEVTEANAFDSTKVAGVVSTDPAYVMNNLCPGEHVATLALQGRVPVKVLGPVEKGDLMVSAPGGYAKANNNARAGTIIGKSLENFYGESGVIEVVVGRF